MGTPDDRGTDGTVEQGSRGKRRWGRRVLLSLFGVGVVVGAFGTALAMSRPGQRLVVDAVLTRVRARLAGTLTVGEVRGSSLFTGAMLVDVRIEGEGARPFMEADSVHIRYSLLGLVGSSPRLRSVVLYRPRVEISRYPGEDSANLSRLVKREDSNDDSAVDAGDGSGGRSGGGSGGGLGTAVRPTVFRVASVRVVDGTLDALTPLEAEEAGRVPTVTVPAVPGRLKRVTLSNLSFDLRNLVLAAADPELLVGRIESLAMDVSVLDRPLHVVDGGGRLSFDSTGLHIREGSFDFPSSSFGGTFALGPEYAEEGHWGVYLDLETTRPSALDDLSWIDDRLPSGTYQGGVAVTAGAGTGLRVELQKVAVDLEASRFSLNGGVDVLDGPIFRDFEVEASPLLASRLEPWLGRDLPLDGWLSGRARFAGRPEALTANGRVTFVPMGAGGGPSTADFRGTFHAGADPGFTDLRAMLDPLSFETASLLLPKGGLAGRGRVRLDASGRADEGIRFVTDAIHSTALGDTSRVRARGSLRRVDGSRWVTDVQGDLSPLSLVALHGLAPKLALRGRATGSVRAVGPLDDLHVTGELAAGRGSADLDAHVDATALERGYRVETVLDRFVLSDFSGALPEPSIWTGRVDVDGRGLTRDDADVALSLEATASRVGGLHIDSVTAHATVSDGVFHLDTLDAGVGGVLVAGAGGIGVAPGSVGEAHVVFQTDDIIGLRPLLRGDTVLARDELSSLERELLRLQGVDVDTLPTSADVAMSGALQGEATFTGSMEALDVEGSLNIRRGRLGKERAGRLDLSGDIRRATSKNDRSVRIHATAEDLEVSGRSFRSMTADATLDGGAGTAGLTLERSDQERYTVAGSFAFDSIGGEVDLEESTFQIDSLEWRLTRPSRVAWRPDTLSIEDMDFTRTGGDPMQVTATGTVAWTGSSDLVVGVRGLHLERVAHVTQLDELGIGGHADLDLSLTGPAVSPVIDASVRIESPRYRDLALDEVSGDVHYQDRAAEVSFEASEEGRRVLLASGRVPIDLALRPDGRRIVSEPMDVRVVADSLDASVALSYLKLLEDVDGVVSGDFRIGGTLDRPEPSGMVRLIDGAWSIDVLGIRHNRVVGNLALKPDRSVDVTIEGSAGGGTSTVTGSIVLDPVTDPKLDLTIDFANFEAVNRRDVTGKISGQVRLDRTYHRPLLEGDLRVDNGVLFLEEFARSTEVVDLTDPRLYGVDTTALVARPFLAEISNPFLQNLRVDVNLSLPRDTWLRSEDMNVEIGGDLLMSYDREQRDLVMVGELEALRGSYRVLGRRFDVQQGTVGFIGIPGINPTLDIEAVAKIRRVEVAPLDVSATVTGTLTQPRVTLSSNEQGVAESDLVSYLIFGRPSYELATAQTTYLQGAAGSLAGAGVSYFSGRLAQTLSAAVAQQIGVDYLSITQAGDFGLVAGTLGGTLAGTQVELGQYLSEDVFFVLIFRPLSSESASSGFFGGARVEVALTDDYNVQGFWEDRFLRSRVGGFGDLGIQASQVKGVFIFREWGY